MKRENEISMMEFRLAQLKLYCQPFKAQEDMDLFFGGFTRLNERLRTVQLCKGVELTIETINKLFYSEILPITRELHSPRLRF